MKLRLSAPGAARRVLSGLVVAALVLGLAEMGSRLALRAPRPALVAQMPDGAEGFLRVQGDSVLPRFQGRFAGPEFPLLPSEAPRVVWLGGSTVRGGSDGVSIDQEAAARVGRALSVEMLNLGAPGMDSERVLGLLPEVLALEPDALVVQTGHNDFGNAVFTRHLGLRHTLAARAGALLERSHLFVGLRGVLRREVPVTVQPELTWAGARPVGDGERDALLRGYQQRTRWLLEDARAAGVAVLLVGPVSNAAWPSLVPECPERWEDLGLLANERGGFSVSSSARLRSLEQAIDASGCRELELARARVLWDRRKPQATELLDLLRDQDPYPVRAGRQVALVQADLAEGVGALMTTPSRHFRALGGGLEHPQLFIDSLHLSAAGHQELAAVVAPALAELMGLEAPAAAPPFAQPPEPLR